MVDKGINGGILQVLTWRPGTKTWDFAGGGSTIGAPTTAAGGFFGPSMAFDTASGQPCVAFANRLNHGRPTLVCLIPGQNGGWRQRGPAASAFPAVDVRLANFPNGTKLLVFNEVPTAGTLRTAIKQFNDSSRAW